MCVIAVKSSGAALPPKIKIEQCFYHNDDGAGYMFPSGDGKTVTINKGFMSFDSFWKSLQGLPSSIKDGCIVMHFRIGTHGDKDAGNCHPFPVCGSFDDMRKLRSKCQLGIAHNGKLNIEPENKTVSDTMQFIKDVLHKHPEHIVGDNDLDILFSMAIGTNRFVSLLPNGKHWIIGEFKQDDKTGVWYSNDSHNRTIPATTVYHHPGGYQADFTSGGHGSAAEASKSCQYCHYKDLSTESMPCSLCTPDTRDRFFKAAASGKGAAPINGQTYSYVFCDGCGSVQLWSSALCQWCGIKLAMTNPVIMKSNNPNLFARKEKV